MTRSFEGKYFRDKAIPVEQLKIKLIGASPGFGTEAEHAVERDPDAAAMMAQISNELQAAREIKDEERTRILEQTLAWVDRLQNMSQTHRQAAEDVLQRLRAREPKSLEKPKLSPDKLRKCIEKTLSGATLQVERMIPVSERFKPEARFIVRKGKQPQAWWSLGNQVLGTPVLLLELLEHCAIYDGGLPQPLAGAVAMQLQYDIVSGELALPRLVWKAGGGKLDDQFQLLSRDEESVTDAVVPSATRSLHRESPELEIHERLGLAELVTMEELTELDVPAFELFTKAAAISSELREPTGEVEQET